MNRNDPSGAAVRLWGVCFPGEAPVAVPSKIGGELFAAEISALAGASPGRSAQVVVWPGTVAEHQQQLHDGHWPPRFSAADETLSA